MLGQAGQLVYGKAIGTIVGGVTFDTEYGAQTIYSGGLAIGTRFEGFGYKIISFGGVADQTILTAEQRISSGGIASRTQIEGGTQEISAGGTAIDTRIDSGVQYVQGGVASGTIIGSKGGQEVYNQAFDTTVESGGVQDVYAGATVNGTVVSRGGVMLVESSGVATHVTVENGGTVYVDGGGLVGVTVEKGGKVIQETVSSGVTARDVVTSSG